MAITVNLDTYNYDQQKGPDWLRYNGPNNTLSVKDYADVKKTAPKPTSTFGGQGKASFKLTRTLTDGTDSVGDGILEVSVSFPADSLASEQAAMITDVATWLASASADSLLSDHDINQ